MRFWREYRPAAVAVAPGVLAVAVAAAGVMLLFSGATPSDPMRFLWLARYTPLILIEISHFLSSILGIALVLVAFGLSRRLGAAWVASLGLLAVAAMLALTKGFYWEESSILLAVLMALTPLREAFPRAARLTRMEITPGWMVSALASVAGAGAVGWWSFQNVDYGQKTVFGAIFDPGADAARAVRSSAAAAVLLLVFGLWRMIATPAAPKVAGEDDHDF